MRNNRANSRSHFEGENNMLTAKIKDFRGPKNQGIFLECKRSQITIFVILALIIVVIIALAVVLIKKPGVNLNAEQNPQAYIEDCVKKSLENAESVQINGNLYPNITDNYIIYMNKKVKYLCKASMFYLPCVNQEPMLIEYVRKNMQTEIKPDVEKCFNDLKKILTSRGYNFQDGNMSLVVDFHDKLITATINKKIIIKKDEVTREFNMFSARLPSPLFNLVDTARNIVNYESTLCEFNALNWEKNYPDIVIKRFVTSDQTKVYTLTDKTSTKEINFAVKTCVLPAGI
jgi:hypothetical protein